MCSPTIANRTAGDHVAIEDEPFDPRPVDRLRMDLHDRHAPSTGPPSFTGTTTTIVAARMRVSRGNTGGNRRLARGVPPGWRRVEDSSWSTNATRARRAQGQLQVVAQVTARRRRAALCAARLVAPLPERSPTAIPWRERPPEMAAWSAKPAATDVVAHATLKECWRPVSARSVRWKRRRIRPVI